MEVPLVEVLLVEVPLVEVPLVDMPLVEVLLVEVPLVEVALMEVPLVEVPLVEVPLVEVPLVEVPLVEVPIVEVPLVEVSSVEVPLVEVSSVGVSLAEVLLVSVHLSPQHFNSCFREFFVTWDREEGALFVCIVMDHYPLGDLDMCLRTKREKKDKFDEVILKKWIGQMLDAITFVHEKVGTGNVEVKVLLPLRGKYL